MWNLTKESKEKFRKANLLPIHESDEEWEIVLKEAEEEEEDIIQRLKDDLNEVKDELIQILPSKFIPYVENGTLNQPTLPKSVREDYLNWMRESEKEFEQILSAAYENTERALSYLPKTVQEVFSQSLHDSIIQKIERDGDNLHLYINTSGGFTSVDIIHFIFKGVTKEETDQPLEVGQWFIYDELMKTDDGFAFRVLFDCPETQWTIYMKDLDAELFYYPVPTKILKDNEQLEETSFDEFVNMLNQDQKYWFITPDVVLPVKFIHNGIELENATFQLDENKLVITMHGNQYTYDIKELHPASFIYTDIYEDPYQDLDETLPFDEIEAAALGNNVSLSIRAWNTMYQFPHETKEVINRILLNTTFSEENEMALSVYVNHFYKEGVLTKETINKYRDFIDED